MSIKIKELQGVANARLERFSGEKYDGRATATTPYHGYYMTELAAVFAENKADYLTPATWRIVADIDGPGEVNVSFEEVAEVEVKVKRDKRFNGPGPGTILSIRVNFREDLLDLTIEQARVYLLKKDRENRLAYYNRERERLEAEIKEAAGKIATLEVIEIEEAAE